MNNLMIDLETMGTGSDAAIISIGAVLFDEFGTGETFYMNIDLQSAIEMGGKVDGDTVMWWLKQSDDARIALWGGEQTHIVSALNLFTQWLLGSADIETLQVWGNGATFDNVILANAIRRNGNAVPWKFYNDRCYRTVKNMRPDIELMRVGTHHNALDDAISQAQHLIAIWDAMK